MLLKRLDVTIQSFLWSQKAGFDETEIKKAINAQLQYLSEKPRLFTVSHFYVILAMDRSMALGSRCIVSSVRSDPRTRQEGHWQCG